MREDRLAKFNDVSILGRYEFFLIVVNETKKKIYLSIKKDRKNYSWIARPIDGKNQFDINASSYLLFGDDGCHGIVFRKRDNRFRVVVFDRVVDHFITNKRCNYGGRRRKSVR